MSKVVGGALNSGRGRASSSFSPLIKGFHYQLFAGWFF